MKRGFSDAAPLISLVIPAIGRSENSSLWNAEAAYYPSRSVAASASRRADPPCSRAAHRPAGRASAR